MPYAPSWLVTALLVLALAGSSSAADSDDLEVAFYRAYYIETAEERYDEACATYETLVDAFTSKPDLRAWVRVRLAACALRAGDRVKTERWLLEAKSIEGAGPHVASAIERCRRALGGDVTPAPVVPPLDATPLDRAIDRGVEWLVQHQDDGGRWPAQPTYPTLAGHDLGVSALSLLALVASGHTHETGPSEAARTALTRGLKALLAQQDTDEAPDRKGRFRGPAAEWIYGHAVAQLVLVRLLAATGDPELTTPVENAVRYSLGHQNPGYGWKYDYRAGRNDSSVTAWMMLGLAEARDLQRAGRLPGVEPESYETSFRGGISWLGRTTAVKTGRTGYETPGDMGSRIVAPFGESYPFDSRLPVNTAAALSVRLRCGFPPSEAIQSLQLASVLENPPVWIHLPQSVEHKSKINMIYWWWGIHVCKNVGGPECRDWARVLADTLLGAQDADGSWPPVGAWGAVGGTPYSTAMGVILLSEVRALR
ncbi:MAG: hypothetical protein AB7I09_20395 [Planctomycetota bacterium]